MTAVPAESVEALGSEDRYQVLRVLGRGGEGTVYLARDRSTGNKSVLKAFHCPIRGTAADGLRRYADTVLPNDLGLPQITLIGTTNDVYAVSYPFISMHRAHQRLVNHVEAVAQAMFGAYCRMQAHLISRCGIALMDTDSVNFLLSGDGRFHFVDFGFAIKTLEHPWVVEEGRLGYGFATMLLSIYDMSIKHEILPGPGYSYSGPCVYCRITRLDALTARHPWTKRPIAEARGQCATAFLNPDFYLTLAERLPKRVPYPTVTTPLNRLLYLPRRARKLVAWSR